MDVEEEPGRERAHTALCKQQPKWTGECSKSPRPRGQGGGSHKPRTIEDINMLLHRDLQTSNQTMGWHTVLGKKSVFKEWGHSPG